MDKTSPPPIHNPQKIVSLLKQLKPTSAKLYVYFMLTQKPGKEFQQTYWNISQETGIKHPYITIKDLVEKGLIKKTNQNNNLCKYILVP